jgi:hypothetical protein
MTHAILRGAGAAILICSLTPAAHAQAQPGDGRASAECRAAKPKKHPFGLGGLLSAARRAGVGDMLNNRMGGGMFGHGKGGQIAGALAGTAVEAASSTVQAAASDQGAAEAAPCGPAQGDGQ